MKKILSGILATTMILSTMGASFATEITQNTPQEEVFQEAYTETLISGTCGDNVTYTFSSYFGALTLSGTGATESYRQVTVSGGATYPWDSWRDKIKTVVVEEGITELGSNIFYNLGNLTSISLPNTLKTVNYNSISTCPQLTSLTLPNSLTSINGYAFTRLTGITSLVVPDSVTYMERNAFYGCTSLKTIQFSKNLNYIPELSFANCTSLTSLVIPDTVTTIQKSAFSGCTSLKTITMGKTLEGMTFDAFIGCTALETVYYNGSEADAAKYNIDPDWGVSLLNANWIYSESTPSTSTTPTVTTPTLSGVPDWASSYVSYAITSGILPNISAYNMDSASNRGLISQALYNYAGNNTNASVTHSFTDTGDFGQSIAWCYANGLMSGLNDSSFGTSSNVTREQFALILRGLAKYQGKDVSGDTSVLSQFSDQSSMNTWAMEGIAWAVNAGLMQGNDGKLDPQGSVTQVQVAIMMNNFMNLSSKG